jgi:hypothetical protein
MISGVYIIRNTVNGKVYAGSTKSFKQRFKSHLYALKAGSHHSVKLQRAWRKYGEGCFVFEKILVCSIKNLLMYEQTVIDYYSSCLSGYNIVPKAGSREGAAHTSEVLEKMKCSQRLLRKKYDWKGQLLGLYEIAELEGINPKMFARRVSEAGWSLADAVAKPIGDHGRLFDGCGLQLTADAWVDRIGCTLSFFRLWTGKMKLTVEQCIEKHKKITVAEFARVSGLDPNMFSARVRNGWSIGDAMAMPKIEIGGHHFMKRVYA